ncbi:MAG: peptidase family protein [Ilumatobacteraceae bacterium]|nr:peptidase family protein [Ilumatobacteraceae bacterium]
MRRRKSSVVLFGLAAMVLAAACSTDQQVTAGQSRAVTTTSVFDEPETTPITDDTQPPLTQPSDTSSPDTSAPTTTAAAPPPDDGDQLVPSGDGAGDVLFPDLGNPGIDVVDYDVDLTYDSVDDSLVGSVTMTIDPTEARSQFTLDSAGPVATRVTVDGVDATFVNDDPELRITPPTALVVGDDVEVRVDYTASPDALTTGELPAGWFNTPGGSYVLNEPDGARRWLPSNDHPSDKATWTFTITVAKGVTAVANGALVSTTDGPAGTTWVWHVDDPMPTYLILLMTGDYELIDGTGPNGLPLVSAVLRADTAQMQPYLSSIGDEIDFFDDYFGPYPLRGYGLAISDSFGGLAMETLGRSLFSRDDLTGADGYVQELVLSHELAHQWFGDSVTPLQWQDIWLNESFATYGQWMWLEHKGLSTVDAEAATALETRQKGTGNATGTPTADEVFTYKSYDGGAIVLHALRRTVGDQKFFLILQGWSAENYGTSRSTADFIALANQVAGTDLQQLFHDWLYATTPPAQYPVAVVVN